MVEKAESDKVDYDDGGPGLFTMIMMLVMILKQCFFVKDTEDLVRRRGKGWSMTKTGRFLMNIKNDEDDKYKKN